MKDPRLDRERYIRVALMDLHPLKSASYDSGEGKGEYNEQNGDYSRNGWSAGVLINIKFISYVLVLPTSVVKIQLAPY